MDDPLVLQVGIAAPAEAQSSPWLFFPRCFLFFRPMLTVGRNVSQIALFYDTICRVGPYEAKNAA